MAAVAADGRFRHGRAFVFGFGLFNLAGQLRGQPRPALGPVEACDEIANLDLVLVLQLHSAADLRIVDLSAVTALQVFDIEAVVDADDLRVLPADARDGDVQIALWFPAQDEFVHGQGNVLSLVNPFDDVERRHHCTSKAAPVCSGTPMPARSNELSDGLRDLTDSNGL